MSRPDYHKGVFQADTCNNEGSFLALYGMESGLCLLGLGVGVYLLFEGGRLLWPFIFLVLSFLALLAYAMRGVGAAPTVVRRAAPRPAPSVSPGQDAPGA